MLNVHFVTPARFLDTPSSELRMMFPLIINVLSIDCEDRYVVWTPPCDWLSVINGNWIFTLYEAMCSDHQVPITKFGSICCDQQFPITRLRSLSLDHQVLITKLGSMCADHQVWINVIGSPIGWDWDKAAQVAPGLRLRCWISQRQLWIMNTAASPERMEQLFFE